MDPARFNTVIKLMSEVDRKPLEAAVKVLSETCAGIEADVRELARAA
jgi:hypothetical protein